NGLSPIMPVVVYPIVKLVPAATVSAVVAPFTVVVTVGVTWHRKLTRWAGLLVSVGVMTTDFQPHGELRSLARLAMLMSTSSALSEGELTATPSTVTGRASPNSEPLLVIDTAAGCQVTAPLALAAVRRQDPFHGLTLKLTPTLR